MANQMLSKKKKEFVRFVVSPGTVGTFADGPKMICPTGEKCLVMREMRMKQMTEQPDPDGKIIMLNTPFFEAPVIRVYTNQGAITGWKAYQLPGYETFNSDDPLKDHQIYGWRMIGNSLTGSNNTALIQASGTVTIATLPLSLDVKHIYDNSGMGMPTGFDRALDYLPLSVDQVGSITNQLITHRASEGSYCVLHHTDPNIPFVYRDSDVNKATFQPYYRVAGGIQSTGDPVWNRLLFADNTTPGLACKDESGNVLAVTMPSAMNLGYTIYSDLPQGTNLVFKAVVAWEFIPKMNSSKISQCVPMSPKDTLLLEYLNVCELTCRSMGTAADNSFGSFMKGLLETASAAMPFVKEISANFVTDPRARAVIDRVAEAIPKINEVVNKVSNSAQSQKNTNQTGQGNSSVPQRVPRRR